MSDPVGVGLVGCGNIARLRHLPALKRLSAARLVAVADLDAERREAAGAEHEVPRSYATADQLVADPEVEVVGVLVSPGAHADVAMTALDAGRHVLIEKPLALDLEGCDRILAAARGSGVMATVGFNLRSHRLIRQARGLLDQGLIGPVQTIRSVISGLQEAAGRHGWKESPAEGGGTLVEKGTHHFDLWRHLGRSGIAEVSAMIRAGGPAEDASTVSARLESGALVTSTFVEAPATVNEISLQGPLGRLDVSIYEFDGLRFTPSSSYPGDPKLRLRQLRSTLRELPHGIRALRRGGEYASSYHAEWRRFLDAIRTGHSPDPSLEDGREATRVALAAVQSAAAGRAVAVADAVPSLDAALGVRA